MSFIQNIDRLTFPRKIQLDYYQSKKPGPELLPNRQDLDFVELRPFLPYLYIAEPISGGLDWKYRLLGTRLVFRFGRDSTGIPFSEHFEEDGIAEDAISISNEVAQGQKPRFFSAQFTITETSQTALETMSLPILAPDGAAIWLFGGTFFADEELGL